MLNRSRAVASILFTIFAALALVFAIGPRGGDAQEVFEMKIGTVAPEATPWEKQLRDFKRYVEAESNGRIKVRAFMGGALGGEKALVRRTAQGTIHAFGGSTAAMASLVPELNVIEAPYLFENVAAADKALDGPVKSKIGPIIERHGFKFGFWAENGFRSWFTKDKPLRTPDDLKGLRMRSQEAEIHLATYRAFQASPVPIDVTNVLTSLQTGVVDGFDNTPLYAFASSWYQAAKHLNLSKHSYQPGIVVYSKRWFDGLPPDLQQILVNIPQSMVVEGRKGVRQLDPILIRNLGNAGIEVHRPTAAERAAFKQKAARVADKVAAKTGRDGRALLRAIRSAQ